MAEWRRVTGRVVTADSRPVAGAQLSLGDIPGLPEMSVIADENGRFVLHLPRIALELAAHNPSGRRAVGTIGKDDTEILLIEH
jgi:hypothetical protein